MNLYSAGTAVAIFKDHIRAHNIWIDIECIKKAELDKLFDTSSSAEVMTALIKEKKQLISVLKPVESIDFVQSSIVSVEKTF